VTWWWEKSNKIEAKLARYLSKAVKSTSRPRQLGMMLITAVLRAAASGNRRREWQISLRTLGNGVMAEFNE